MDLFVVAVRAVSVVPVAPLHGGDGLEAVLVHGEEVLEELVCDVELAEAVECLVHVGVFGVRGLEHFEHFVDAEADHAAVVFLVEDERVGGVRIREFRVADFNVVIDEDAQEHGLPRTVEDFDAAEERRDLGAVEAGTGVGLGAGLGGAYGISPRNSLVLSFVVSLVDQARDGETTAILVVGEALLDAIDFLCNLLDLEHEHVFADEEIAIGVVKVFFWITGGFHFSGFFGEKRNLFKRGASCGVIDAQ